MDSSTVFLKDEKLRQLAEVIRGYEIKNLYYITFKNLGEKLQYISMCNDNMASVNTRLDECNALVASFKDDPVRGPIANKILAYAETCLNNALQIIRNYTMRSTYLEKMKDHHHQLYQALHDLDTSSKSDVDEFSQLIDEYDQKVMNYIKLYLNSYASAVFSRYLRNSGIGFDELVKRYQAQVGYTGKFADLTEEQKLEVYAAIIEASGRLNVLETTTKLEGDVKKDAKSIIAYGAGIAQYGSAAMFIYDVGKIVWDVFSSDHPLTTALREALELAVDKGGSYLGELVGTAIATNVLGDAASALFITAVGIIGGIVGAFIIGAAAGLLFDLIFGSGGQEVLPTDGFIVYVAEMPDGHNLAKIL